MIAVLLISLVIPRTIICFASSPIIASSTTSTSSLRVGTPSSASSSSTSLSSSSASVSSFNKAEKTSERSFEAVAPSYGSASYVSKTGVPIPPMNMLSKLTFSWVKQLMVVGNKRRLEITDLFQLPEDRKMETSSIRYEDMFQKEVKISRARNESLVATNSSILASYWASPVTKVLMKMYRKDFISSGLLKLVNTIVQFLPSLIIARLLKYIDLNLKPASIFPLTQTTLKTFASNPGVVLAALLLLILNLKTLIENQYFDVATTMGSSIRGTVTTAVFRKSLRLSSSSRQKNTMGEIVNYSQLDASKMEQVFSSIHILWDGIFQVDNCILSYCILLELTSGLIVLVGGGLHGSPPALPRTLCSLGHRSHGAHHPSEHLLPHQVL